jgi:transketolase
MAGIKKSFAGGIWMAQPEEIKKIRKIAWDLRADVVEMIGVGKPGHIGGSCSLAEIVAALYFGKMHFDPKALKDPNRDRFLVSKGHSVPIQYAALVELGAIPREEMAKLKTLTGKLQGHPDLMTPGMEAVTGSLGQGLSIACGMALTLRLRKSSARVYVVMGDGELAEGQLWEAGMAAARYKLDNITAIVDRNRIQATGPTKDIFDIPNLEDKWRAFGWNVLSVDGHDVSAILAVLDEAAALKGAPTVIIAETIKGKGISFAENTAAFHNAALSQAQYDQALVEIAESGRMVQ